MSSPGVATPAAETTAAAWGGGHAMGFGAASHFRPTGLASRAGFDRLAATLPADEKSSLRRSRRMEGRH